MITYEMTREALLALDEDSRGLRGREGNEGFQIEADALQLIRVSSRQWRKTALTTRRMSANQATMQVAQIAFVAGVEAGRLEATDDPEM